MNSSNQPLVFIDLETTGANFARDRIIEIGLVEVDADGVREWSTLVNPGVGIKPFITELTGIDDGMVVEAPAFAEVADELRERLRGRLFVAHNARFDYGFIKGEFARLGVDFKASVLCTVKLSRKLFPEHHRHNLDTLMTRHGIVADARHRALADARVLWDLWQAWHRELGAEGVQSGLSALVRPVVLPPQLDPALAEELPECPGAYALIGADGLPLVVGRATNLRQKVLAHFADARSAVAPASETQAVEWRDAAGELGARLQEIALQRRLKPVSAELCAWQLVEHGDGDFRPLLTRPDEVEFGGDTPLYGLYNTQKEARQALRKLAEGHFLCPVLLGLESVREGKPCSATKNHHCRGACIGKEPISRHSARLMTALAKLRLKDWPFAGPVAIVERDEFGMIEDFNLVDRWRHLATVRDDSACQEALGESGEKSFDPDVYRTILKYVHSEKLRVIPFPAPPSR